MEIRSILGRTSPELVDVGGKKILHLHDSAQLKSMIGKSVDAIVIKSHHLASELRAMEEFYLSPLFLEGEETNSVDGHFDPNNPHAIITKIERLQEQLSKYQGLLLPDDPEQRSKVKILRYMVSRQMDLDPIRTRSARISYDFDIVEQLVGEKDHLQILRYLNRLSEEGLLRPRSVDKVNLCHSCDGNYLNFTECCVNCGSIDLDTQNLIHHFRCAYIGPESDFMKEGTLHCPKCDKQLKHIGIDYDKPSEINTCKQCNHATQETDMKANCVDCGSKNSLDQLTTYVINSYSYTDKGAEFSFMDRQEKVDTRGRKDISGRLLNKSIFDLLVHHESQKQDLYSEDLWMLDIEILDTVLGSLSARFRESLLEELGAIVEPYLKEHDLMSLVDEKVIRIALLDYNKEAAGVLMEVLNYNLEKMLKDNSCGDGDVVKIELKELNNEPDLAEHTS